jgi:TetR/AcrR family transcriptional regulator
MARPRSAQYDAHRAQILEAAARVFAERGYTAATMNEVAAAAGVSKATLYHYYGDKSDLLEQVASSHVARLEALVQEVGAQCLAPPEHLRELVRSFLHAYGNARHAHRVLTEDVKFLQPQARAGVTQAQRRVVAAFAQAIGRAQPQLDPALQRPVAMLLFGMINWTFTWLRPEGAFTHDALAPVVLALLDGGLPAVPGAVSSDSAQGAIPESH